MTTLNIPSPALRQNGPILDVYISQKSLIKEKREQIFTPVNAIIDTGATYSAIDIRLAEILKLTTTDKREILLLPDSYKFHDVYNVDFVFDSDNPKIYPISANGMDLSYLSCENLNLGVIIGRDVLSKCIFTYNGLKNKFTIEF